MDQLLRLITLQDANTRVVLLGAALLGLAAGTVGSFAVLRRRALVGDALAHAALPGVCVAYFVAGDRDFVLFLVGALVFGLLGVGAISLVRAYTRIKEDAALAIVLSAFFGLGIMLSDVIQRRSTGNRAGLETFIMGKAAGMVRQDLLMIGVCAAAAIGITALLFKEFKLLCFDRGFAASLGRPVLGLDLGLMGLIAVCTVIGLPAVGAVLMAALLIIPAAAARFWTERLWVMVCVSAGIGMLSGVVGVGASALWERLAAGPLVVLSAGTLFAVSALGAPRRGVIAGAVRRASLRRRVARQNLLRSMHELDEADGAPGAWHPLHELALRRSWSGTEMDSEVARAERSGLVRIETSETARRVALTARGQEEARAVVRAHRLWELYLIEQADIAPDHVDRDADAIEHVLPRDVIERLEAKLRRDGRLPGCPHDLSATGGAP
jgi:manganese/zinc/iron transport system permease protein